MPTAVVLTILLAWEVFSASRGKMRQVASGSTTDVAAKSV